MRMYKIWRKITKNLAYMQEMSSRNVFFAKKKLPRVSFRGRRIIDWVICCLLFTNLDKHIEQMAHSLPYAIRSSQNRMFFPLCQAFVLLD